MAFTQITSTNLNTDLSTQISAGVSANNAVANIISLTIRSAQVANSSYVPLDDTAANTGGGYLVLTGTGFTPNCIVIIGQTNATSTSYVNTTCIRAQTQAFSAATYNIYVVDAYTGATAIKVNGYTTSSFPVWGTSSSLNNQQANTSFSVSLSANSDSNITYSNTTALPSGTTLLANGYFYGTVSIATQTTYSFDVKATDAELQDATRTFSLTVTVVPQTKLWSFGKNNYGQLGQNDLVYRSSPTQIGTGTTWNKVSGSFLYFSAIKNDGTLWSWGATNNNTAFNDTNFRSSPTQVGALTNWADISVNRFHTLALKTDGTLWAWGSGGGSGNGLIGDNTTVDRSSPVQIGTDTNWSKISTGFNHSVAVKSNGTLWAWGANETYGQLGINTNATGSNKSSPVQIGTDTNWATPIGGTYATFAIKTNGTLWSWGWGTYGNLGNNTVTNVYSPVQLGSDTNWSFGTGGFISPKMIKTDGTLWSWGYDANGQNGLNTSDVHKSSPTQVGVGTTWLAVSVGSEYSASGVKSDGTLWTWGNNAQGQLGINNTTYKSSPTQVGTGTNWANVFGSGRAFIAKTSA